MGQQNSYLTVIVVHEMHTCSYYLIAVFFLIAPPLKMRNYVKIVLLDVVKINKLSHEGIQLLDTKRCPDGSGKLDVIQATD